MNEKEDKLLKDALLHQVELSPELRKRFEEQMNSILHPKLSKKLIYRNYFLIVVWIFGICAGSFMMYSAFTSKDLPESARLFLGAAGALMALHFLAGTFLIIKELKSGHALPRKFDTLGIGMGPFLLMIFCIWYFMVWRSLDLSVKVTIHIAMVLLFFWTMAVGGVLLQTARWNKEDILIEQKRTQLEIALLREEILKKNSGM